MKKESLKNKLKNLYNKNSKHYRYQSIPDFLKGELDYNEVLDHLWRDDLSRYAFLKKILNKYHIDSIADIGANSGFFSLSLAHDFTNKKITAIEQNEIHCQFMELIKDCFKISNLSLNKESVVLNNINKLKKTDLILLFNVLHHAGVDFSQDKISNLDDFNLYISKYLKKMATRTKYLIFQMGFNWGGNKQKPIISLEKDIEKIKYLIKLFNNESYKILKIIYPHRKKDHFVYQEINKKILVDLLDNNSEKLLTNFLEDINIKNNSEFFRRPIIFAESLM
ncbi:MAG: class I SAM-dependent methyltransferase [Patescibacteria group bacterium]